jgi:hypothetical protein
MGAGVLFIVFIYFAAITIAGRIVLKRIPGFRLSFGNLLVFIIGATTGMFAFVNLFVYCIGLIIRILKHDVINLSQSGESVLAFFLAAVGSALGGIGLVWLKMRFEKAPQNKERTTSSR